MKVGLAGRGRAARTLGPLLEAAGHDIVWSWSRADATDPSTLPAACAVLLAVPDGAIEDAARALSSRPSAAAEVWLHLAGSRPGAAARVSAGVPRAAGCLHPLVAFPASPAPPEQLRGAAAGIDGDDEALEVARALALDLGLVPRVVASEKKPLYHAAAVTVAGHEVALFSQALAMLEAAGFPPDEARAALLPLARGALENLARAPDPARAPRAAISGPVSRGDAGTVRAHLEALAALDPLYAETYRGLARTALAISAADLGAASVRAIGGALSDAAGGDVSGPPRGSGRGRPGP